MPEHHNIMNSNTNTHVHTYINNKYGSVCVLAMCGGACVCGYEWLYGFPLICLRFVLMSPRMPASIFLFGTRRHVQHEE